MANQKNSETDLSIPAHLLDRLFASARTRNGWLDQPLPSGTIEKLYEVVKWAPTSANSNPARFVFVLSAAGRERLRPHLSPANLSKTMAAPCCVIIAYDTQFYDFYPQLFPARDMRPMFAANEKLASDTAFRNSSLQGAYLIIAARALGLDCGPMSGFNADTLNADFFPDGRWKANFLCNIGYGSDENLFPRNPRLEFEEACRVL